MDCQIDPRLPLLWSLDFNVDPLCSVIAQRTQDTLWVLDEIVLSPATTSEACEEFIRRYGRHRAGVRVYGDASGNNRHTSGDTDYGVVGNLLGNAFGRSFTDCVGNRNPAVSERILMVNSKLKSAAEEVSLYVSPKCANLILDFEQVVYGEKSREINKTKDSRRTHLSDALGYLVWEDFRPQMQIGEQSRRLF